MALEQFDDVLEFDRELNAQEVAGEGLTSTSGCSAPEVQAQKLLLKRQFH